MSIWGDSAATLINRLRDILTYSDTGNHVENYALDLLNRAQSWISMYRPWDFLKKIASLTIGNDRTATLPSDLNTILQMYIDIEGVGKPSVYLYPDAPDPAERYEIFDNFSAASGHSWYIQIPSVAPLPGPLFLKYTYNLPAIAAADNYLFYPSELLLRTAQKLHIADKGVTGDSANLALAEFERVMGNFIRNSQYNNHKQDLGVQNKYGNPVKIGGHALDGSKGSIAYSPYLPSTFMVR